METRFDDRVRAGGLELQEAMVLRKASSAHYLFPQYAKNWFSG